MDRTSISSLGNIRASLRLIVGGTTAKESLLLLSDVHLGSDLTPQAQETGFGRRSKRVDDDLAQMISHYRKQKPEGERWRLVIAGDFIDFIGMKIPHERSGEVLLTEPNEEEMEHGLGGAADHAKVKLRMCRDRHPQLFQEFAAFVADGNTMTMVHGNHDLEFYWEEVRELFKELLFESLVASPMERLEFKSRIEFNAWFFYVSGVVYVEHGHQYDPYCATDHVMAPLSPLDRRRTFRGFSETLLRFIVRPTRGLPDHGHENLGIVDYIRFGVRLGIRDMVRLGFRFVSAIVELLRLRLAHVSEAAKALRAEHERRVALLSEATRIGVDKLKALAALQSPPVTRSIYGILASVLIDRIALGMMAGIAVIVAAVVQARHGHGWIAALLIVVAWALLHRHLTKLRKIDPTDSLANRAGNLAQLFPAAFVVMGHTHLPERTPVNAGTSTYINLGSWAEEENGEMAGSPVLFRAARTHLVIHPGADGPRAEFLRWESNLGPCAYDAPLRQPSKAEEEEEFEPPRKAG